MTTSGDFSFVLLELGLAIVGLAALARLANRWGFSAIPLYLVAGLSFGNGGIAPLPLSEGFIHIGAEIGVLLLLFMMGLEYGGEDLKKNLRKGLSAGVVDLALNFTPGLVAGIAMGWRPMPAVLLGGVTYISSSGIIARMLTERRWLDKPETPVVMSVLVLEDLAMAAYLPLVSVLLVGGSVAHIGISIFIAIAVVFAVMTIAVRYGRSLSRFAAHESDEIVLLTAFGVVLLVAGLAQHFRVSAAIGAFLVGIAVSDPIAEQSRRLLSPLRDLFAATFFFFFGIQIDPSSLPPVLPIAMALGIATALTKLLTGYWAARQAGLGAGSGMRTGMALIARGEFSIVIAGLGDVLEPRLGPLSAAYVLLLAVCGPLLNRERSSAQE